MNEANYTSKKISKRLKEAGAVQDAEHYWVQHHVDHLKDNPWWKGKDLPQVEKPFIKTGKIIVPEDRYVYVYAAYSSDEIARVLPYMYVCWRYRDNWYCGDLNNFAQNDERKADTMANALGLMWEHLLINKLM